MSRARRAQALTGSLAAVAAAALLTLPASAATSPAASPAPPAGDPTAAPTTTVGPATPGTAAPAAPTTTAGPGLGTATVPPEEPATKPKTYVISKHTISVLNRYVINPDGTHETMTLTNVGYGDNFTVQTQTRKSSVVLASPNFLYGCSWGICSPHRTLPVQVKHDGNPGASVDTAGHPAGLYNAAYDIWFELKPYLNGQPHGAEIMIWPRETPGIGTTRGYPEVRVDGALYWFIHWRARNSRGSWNYIQFRKVSQVNDLRGLHVNDFIKVAEAHRLLSANWYLQNITAGFEIWTGGKGLQMSNFWAQG
ncbi:MAG TPA: hypothetical protein VKV33_12445 [Streptosporangiaceae bacterium]|nr:hypothetical protein [Streptosporangiaceae bacterium]